MTKHVELPKCKVPCLICAKQMDNIMATDTMEGNQPASGLEFFKSYGHYGSTEFDPMDGTFLIVNICDDCLSDAREAGRVLHARKVDRSEIDYVVWERKQDE